jgi:hypothetical protein
MPSADDMAKAMAMMQAMNEAMNAATESGQSVQEATMSLGGAATPAGSAQDLYGDEQVYGAPRVIVLEETAALGETKPVRYVVVFRDLTLGKTGIALHAPPVL